MVCDVSFDIYRQLHELEAAYERERVVMQELLAKHEAVCRCSARLRWVEVLGNNAWLAARPWRRRRRSRRFAKQQLQQTSSDTAQGQSWTK